MEMFFVALEKKIEGVTEFSVLSDFYFKFSQKGIGQSSGFLKSLQMDQ
jgi:hypothetical protein